MQHYVSKNITNNNNMHYLIKVWYFKIDSYAINATWQREENVKVLNAVSSFYKNVLTYLKKVKKIGSK